MDAHSEHFRLLDLPQELRDQIYELALEPKAIFHHTFRGHIVDGYHLPGGVAVKGIRGHQREEIIKDCFLQGRVTFDVPESIDDTIWNDIDPDEELPEFGPVLSFKIAVTTQLLLVSRTIYREMREYLRAHKTRYIDQCNDIIASAIYARESIVSPSTVFCEIWSRSILVFSYGLTATIRFLNHLPVRLAAEIHSVVLDSVLVMNLDVDPTISEWHIPVGKQQSFFGQFLDKLFPSIKHIALKVVRNLRIVARFFDSVPIEICNMLKKGRLDVVRFYYKVRGGYDTDVLFLHGSNLPMVSVTLTPESEEIIMEFEKKRGLRARNNVHECDVVEESVVDTNVIDKSLGEIWKLLEVGRVVKITRRADMDTSTEV